MASQFRQLALSKQGLLSHEFGTGLSGTLNAIEHLGYVQIDTLSVVERAHHHVLWNRVPGYSPTHLNQLVREKLIFEHWFHAASYLPVKDYRYAIPMMVSIRNGENRYYKDTDEKLMREILARVQAEGSLKMRDFKKEDKNKSTSWSWGPVRRALDKLFMQGDLMIRERDGMEKIYALPEHCLPEGIDLSMPTLSEYAAYLFDTTLKAHGVFTWKQLIHLKTGQPLRDAMSKVLDARIEAGIVQKLDTVDGLIAYVDAEASEELPASHQKTLKILSPFDNAIIHRDRLSALFKFDYRLECYVTPAKRVYGYFCLPILYADKFVGRMDCKAHRAKKQFEVLSLHLENEHIKTDQFTSALRNELQKFAEFNQCPVLSDSVIDE
ncbi:winged helix-turn-helix domain-containing protein [Marinicella sp. W31]|uniref:winged helix-turn-helix domain-containing protein n=1 Tax=Marinicella sp. W31 TaxID=3023713 RepID=UPI0037564C38